MSRVIDVIVITDTGPRSISHMVAPLIGSKVNTRDNGHGIRVGGAGMDMGFHVVYSFAAAVHGDGYAFTQRWL